MATKSTTKKTPVTTEEVKLSKFVGILYQYTPVKGSTDRICWFDTLNAKKTKAIEFAALLTDSEEYIARYIKNHILLETTVKELPPVEGKRRFEIVSMMPVNKQTNFNALLKYAECEAKA